jgi:hypothetical protein
MSPDFLILITCLASAILASSTTATARETCTGKSAPEVSSVFAKAIDLNDSFKKSAADKDETAYRSLRAQVEHDSEETVFPCVRRAEQILSRRNDPTLMKQLLKLVVSYENSADEAVSASLGRIFARNPAAIEHGIQGFPDVERKLIASSIQAGWTNTKKGLASTLVRDRDKRIKRLTS